MKRLYIYGAPGSGKTTLAKKLAADFSVQALDLDEMIVHRIGMPIADYFGRFGEEAFREVEAEMLRVADAPVVALGGGSLLREDSRRFALDNGFVVVLDTSEEEIARRIALGGATRPLGNKAAERREHYASFKHHAGEDSRIVLPGKLIGTIEPPVSKSHLHRLMIAAFLAEYCKSEPLAPEGQTYAADAGASEDIAATRRCLEAMRSSLVAGISTCTLDCGESGSTLRILAPVAAALGLKAEFVRHGRLAERPNLEYETLAPGKFELAGNVSSQFVTGLLFALPLLEASSSIVFTSPLESRGYVEMTLDVLRKHGIEIKETQDGFEIPGAQKYSCAGAPMEPERDWSGAAFWYAARALGADVAPTGLSMDSFQPDRAVEDLIAAIKRGGATIDISQTPDLYPALAVVAAVTPGTTRFINASRLRLKESDRIAAMEEVLGAFGVQASSTESTAEIQGTTGPLRACEIDTRADHRVAMAAAIAALRADGPVVIHQSSCVAKSYPGFFDAYRPIAADGGF